MNNTDYKLRFITEIQHAFDKYIGKFRSEIIEDLNIDASISNKSINQIIINAIIEKEISKKYKYLINSENLKIKAFRVSKDMRIKESMSLPPFRFKALIQTEWDKSELKHYFFGVTFIFLIFLEYHSDFILNDLIIWEMSDNDLNGELKQVFERTKQIINEGVILVKRGNIVTNNLPKKSDSKIAHVRPHASKASYKPFDLNADELPDGRWMTKQCFFINNNYTEKIVQKRYSQRQE